MRHILDTRRRLPAVLAAAAALTVLVSGCTGQDPNASAKTTQIVVAYQNQTTTLDPVRADYVQTDNLDQALYDTLVTYDKDRKLAGRLATSYTYNAQVDALTVTLRDGVAFHSGNKLTAEDVKFTLDRAKSLSLGVFGYISSYASTEVKSPTQLVIHLSRPDALFLGALSRVHILDHALVAQHAGADQGQSWLLDHEAGSGPYSLKDVSSGTYTLSRAPHYWQFDATRPDRLVMRRIDDLATTKQEIQAGNVDIGSINPADRDSVSKSGLKVTPTTFIMAYVYFNNATGPTADPAVRRAVMLAYDYAAGLKQFRGNVGSLAAGPLLNTLTCRPDLPTVGQNLDQAKKVLADAGIHDLTLTMRFQPAFADQAQEATLLQSNLKEIGVTLNLQPIAYADYLTTLQSKDTIPEMMLGTASPVYPDAGVDLTKQFATASIGTTNQSAYSNSKVDALISKANSSADAQARCDLYKQAQTIVSDDAAIMPMYNTARLKASRPDILDVDFASPNGNVAIEQLRIKK